MQPSPPKILIVTFGSYGDLFPFVALGLALQREGFRVVVATSATHREIVLREGLEFAAMRPDLDDVTRLLGLDLGGLARAMSADDGFLFQKVIFPFLRDSFDDVCAAAEGAVAIVAHAIAFAAHAAAETLELPLFVTHLSPALHYSPNDPPQSAPFIAAPQGRFARAYNRAALGVLARVACLWAAPLRRFRRGLGLPERAPFALFAGVAPSVHRLGLHSPLLLRDGDADVVGHTFFDRGPEQAAEEARALEAFLARGPAPIVFTLGSFVVRDRAAHHRACVDASLRLNQRAILLADDDDAARLRGGELPGTIHVSRYAPHGALFGRARIIAHHGGVGTSGQALRAGKPQLVTPFLGDQSDNAARLARLGVARVLPGKKLSVERLTKELRALLENEDFAGRAEAIGRCVAREGGAEAAAKRIVNALSVRARGLTPSS